MSEQDLIHVSATRNWIAGDPILDWLELYGRDHGYTRDNEHPAYLPECDFLRFIMRKGREFEAGIMQIVEQRLEVVRVVGQDLKASDPAAAQTTRNLLESGVECIYQAALVDHELGIIGVPDLLVRADCLSKIVPGAESGDASHYRVVDIKFSTIPCYASGEIGDKPVNKAQLALYNLMLSRIQNQNPKIAYILGRSWTQKDERGNNALARLLPVTFPQPRHHKPPFDIEAEALEAVQWIKDLREHGAGWTALPSPTRQELRPNMTNKNDAPWHRAKSQIAKEQEELTLLWQVGKDKRDDAIRSGITKISDPRVSAATLGLGASYSPKLEAILAVNREPGPLVRPARVMAGREVWANPQPVEFFVDFETVTDLDDDMSCLPERGGCTTVFMVGCGHEENGEWQFECFIADALAPGAENRMIDAWYAHMRSVRDRLAPGLEHPVLYHWSPAEPSFLGNAYNSAARRLKRPELLDANWYDLLAKVFREEPVVVHGMWGFGLKDVAKNLHRHGLIETIWTDGPTDGLGAMAGAWWCYAESARTGLSVREVETCDPCHRLMKEIQAYNEVDCRTMWEIAQYLLERHA